MKVVLKSGKTTKNKKISIWTQKEYLSLFKKCHLQSQFNCKPLKSNGRSSSNKIQEGKRNFNRFKNVQLNWKLKSSTTLLCRQQILPQRVYFQPRQLSSIRWNHLRFPGKDSTLDNLLRSKTMIVLLLSYRKWSSLCHYIKALIVLIHREEYWTRHLLNSN